MGLSISGSCFSRAIVQAAGQVVEMIAGQPKLALCSDDAVMWSTSSTQTQTARPDGLRSVPDVHLCENVELKVNYASSDLAHLLASHWLNLHPG